EGQSLRARRQTRGLAAGRAGARSSSRGAHRQRHRVHARAGRRARSSRNALTRVESEVTRLQPWPPDMDPIAADTRITTQMADSGAVVTLESVTVTYGRNQAMRDVTASFAAGAVGLLGPNGAGKSTMLKALLGFVAPDRGRMRVLGFDVAHSPLDIRARVGYMPESDAHIPGMNAVSFVAYCGELAGLPRVDAMQRAHEVLFYVGLGDARYRNVETYSTGMKQRIKLAQALVH